jgi:hypothetical protein
MLRGGSNPNAGRKKGSTVKVASAEVRLAFKPLMDELTQQFLTHRDPRVKRRAWEVMVPYIYQRMPQVTELSGLNKEPIQIEIVHIVQDSDQGNAGI